jgi:hypothetical protein
MPDCQHAFQVRMLRSALAFYADPAHWAAVRLPDGTVPADEIPVILDGSGETLPVETWQSGPAMDGGEHARYALSMFPEP